MINLTPAQAKIASDTHRFRVVNCGRRFGKTTLAIEEIKGYVANGAKRICYIAPTYQQSRDIAWEILKREFKGASFNESRLEIRVGDCLVVLRGWEAVETLRGQFFDFLVIDEIAMMRNFWINWQEVLRPTLTDTKGSVLFISTPKGFNHFYDLYGLEKEDKDYKSYHFTSFDNPFIPKEELEKAKLEITEDRFAQEYMADFRKTEGLVYKEFDRNKYLFDDATPLPDFNRTILGIDFGFTNPACILCIREDSDSRYWITEEWYKTKQTTEQIAQKALSYKPFEVYPDPAEPDRIQEMMSAGLNVREVSKDIVNGINRVREFFKQGRIMIHKDCRNLIWELETYRYPEKKPDHNEEEKPVKENDHAVDALRYALYTVEPQTIEFNYEFRGTDW